MTKHIAFYSGPHCHLCDVAADVVAAVKESQEWTFEKINIKTDHQLMHLYGARIPVLKRTDTQEELGWPFDEVALREFLR
ncbi:glutaredoxin family protein [Aestuariibacter sp. AA17]|uniref:Glutaredoxin family protein n=1 Tax=Fluctibacter corallii TaxID=2984329 RepID=A0ABT3A684_9ALTE|nr:glutaredoxin family protein [Aestuariibacter sp. AA17]MCV2884153.1 glutaredoxin family protein [Aestuariibacter sp. AA17]